MAAGAQAGVSLGLSVDIVPAQPAAGDFPLVADRRAAPIFLDPADFPGVLRAAGDLEADIERVSGVRPERVTAHAPAGAVVVIAGTIGKCQWIDQLVRSGKIQVSGIVGKWESFSIATVTDPWPGVAQALVIAGSDKRGTIYGLYEISEQIGVSPWYWWADVPPKHHEALYLRAGVYVQGPPVVKYRGIFINDEEPALGGWAREKFGGLNSQMYAHMFELILRLRGNYLWPAMWGKAFNVDDPRNPKLADEYGIVMGTSHHEPMMRAQQEWTTQNAAYGYQWNYLKNAPGLKRFWADGIVRNKDDENLVTMGMRGDGDLAMPDAGGIEANKQLLERIITDQRQILADQLHTDPAKVPQLWALFTEVQAYYDAGMRVPDDITLLFTDDNVGNLRRLPTAAVRQRSGGAGIYFHMDMNGGPFSYKWLNSNPLPKVWEQMNLACAYGATRIWIVNVGDLKPLEIPLEFFLRMAWNPAAFTPDTIAGWTRRWAAREFGPEHAVEIADLAAKYAKYNGWRKPELLKPDTFSLTNYREAERVAAAWTDLVVRAGKLGAQLPPDQRDAFLELVRFPVEACANLVELEIAAGRNALDAKQGRTSANAEAERVRVLFARDRQLSDTYNHQLAGGKWDHMMDQTHIGYTNWQSPVENIMPPVTEVPLRDTADFGVAIDGSTDAWPGGTGEPALPSLDSLNRGRSYIDVFARGTRPPGFRASADQRWIRITEAQAPGAGTDRRLWIDVAWDELRPGEAQGAVTISGDNGRSVTVRVTALKATDAQAKAAAGAFGGLAGPIAFWAEEATKNVPAGGVRWERIPDYGRGPSAMEVFPVTASTVRPPDPAPSLEYPVYFARAGKYEVQLITGPTLDTIPGRGLGVAVGLDDQPPQVVNVFTPETMKLEEPYFSPNYFRSVSDNARVMRFTVQVDTPGRHALRISMVDPTVAIEEIVIHDAPLPVSYFGPPPVSY